MSFLLSLINSMPNAIAQGMVYGIMAIGVYITYKIMDIADLTVYGSLCTGGAVCVIMVLNGHHVLVAMLCAVIAGMITGLITGLLCTKFGIPAILSGILLQLGLYSINLHIMGWGTETFSKSNLAISVDKYNLLASSRFVKAIVPNNPIFSVGIFIIIVIALLYWFFGTEIGCALRATGANQNMARAQGINTSSSKVLALMISNGLVALSGALLAQFQGYADVNMGRGAIVIGLAAVIIGEVIFSKIFRNFALKLLSCVLGAIIYYMVLQFVLKLGLSTDDLKLLSATVVALFLAVPYWKANYAATHVKEGRKC